MKYTLFIEGKQDKVFIESYLKHLFNDRHTVLEIEIIPTDGWTNLPKVKPKLDETIDANGLNFVLFDADFPDSQNNGGFNDRKNKLIEIQESLMTEFKLFLFPNNENNGTLEHMFENIINEEHSFIMKCFNNYENCIGYNSNSGNYNLPVQKSKIYAYLETVASKADFKKVKDRDFSFNNPNYWNLEADYLRPLKDFLKAHIVV